MIKEKPASSSARGGVTILCFMLIIAGQAWLLRKTFPSVLATPAMLVECLFCLLMLAGIVRCWKVPMGWGGKRGQGIALALFVLYAVVNTINYQALSTAYLSGTEASFPSAGGALLGLKLVLALVGVIAGIPTIAPIDGREYATRMREKLEKQNLQYATESIKGAQKDLDATIRKLRETLSEEELTALLSQLQQNAPASNDPATPPSTAAGDKDHINPEDWRGWGNGI